MLKDKYMEIISNFTSINNYFDIKLSKMFNDIEYLYSSYCITFITILLYISATNETRNQISNMLGLENDRNDKNIIRTMIDIYDDIKDDVKIINGMFVDDIYYKDIKNNFLRLLKRVCSVISSDFNNNKKKIILSINEWINELTNNNIQKILSYEDIENLIEREIRLIIINVIYIKFRFMNSFERKRINNKEIMHLRDYVLYYETNNFQMIELINDNKNLAIGIMISKNDYFEYNFIQHTNHLQLRYVDINMPIFTKKCKLNLNTIFSNLNVKRMFEINNAEFYNFIDTMDNFYVNAFIHGSILTIENIKDEPSKISNNIYVSFNANKFQYYIKHISTDTIIMNGVYDE